LSEFVSGFCFGFAFHFQDCVAVCVVTAITEQVILLKMLICYTIAHVVDWLFAVDPRSY